MSYQDFLAEFAHLEGVESAEALLANHKDRYSFQINSRERGRQMIDTLERQLGYDFAGKKVLDVGCAYGSFAIELANKGAKAVGIDVSDKWLMLADLNAYQEADVPFFNCDASSRVALEKLAPHGPYDFIVLNDVFEHIYDTEGLLYNFNRLLSEDGMIYYKVPNGLNPRNVLLEGHKKVFGLTLLPPDYWHWFIDAPFHIYYRRWGYYRALLNRHGLIGHLSLDDNHDKDIVQTRRHIEVDIEKVRRKLRVEEFENSEEYGPEKFGALLKATDYYFREVEKDLADLPWPELHHKYRMTFWKGVISRNQGLFSAKL